MKDTLELWLVRHGQTTWNALGKMAGWSDVPLSEEGRKQALALRSSLDHVEFEGVWSSDLMRAVATAELANKKPVKDSRLREINFGEFEGVVWSEITPAQQESINKFEQFSAPGGETSDEAKHRIECFISDLHSGRHIIFTHGGVIRILTGSLGMNCFVGNGTIVVVNWTKKKIISTLSLPPVLSVTLGAKAL